MENKTLIHKKSLICAAVVVVVVIALLAAALVVSMNYPANYKKTGDIHNKVYIQNNIVMVKESTKKDKMPTWEGGSCKCCAVMKKEGSLRNIRERKKIREAHSQLSSCQNKYGY